MCRNGDANTGKAKRAQAFPIRRRRPPDRRTNATRFWRGGGGAETPGVVTAAETTKVKKMDDNCRRKRKEYSERTDGGPGRGKRGRNGSAAEDVCVCEASWKTHTRTEVSADVPWPSL